MSKTAPLLSKFDTNSALFKAKRLKQIFYATEITFVAGIFVQFVVGALLPALYLAVACVLIYPVKNSADRGQVIQGATLLLVILTLLVGLLILKFQGVKDVALLAFPGILIFSVMVGNGTLFIRLFSIMIVVVTIAIFRDLNSDSPVTLIVSPLYDGVLAIIILSVIGYSVWLWSNDLRNLFAQLETENKLSRKREREIEHIAQHDALTQLPNRLLAKKRFQEGLRRTRKNGLEVALVYLDLDNFKEINDTLGHDAGDKFLKVIAQRLTEQVRDIDTVSRQGGDEFLIILKGIKDTRDIVSIAEKLIQQVSLPVLLSNNNFECSASVGISVYSQDGNDYETLLRKADLAMFHAKEKGKNNFQFYDDKLKIDLINYLDTVKALKSAINNQEFALYYQPKYHLSSGRISGAEALIRWQHPTKGMVPPNEFIDIAEKSGLIVEMGHWIISKACSECLSWQSYDNNKDGVHVGVAINVSPIQFAQDNIFQSVVKALKETGLPAEQLELEVTESLLLDETEQLNKTIDNINQLGVKTSIDDFGTGYSNLKYLKTFKTSFIKIDQSFIRNMLSNNEDMAIVRAITQMAHSSNIQVIAEGVETKEQLEALKEIGCDYGQGFYWSKPVPCDKFVELLVAKDQDDKNEIEQSGNE